jgi:NADH-quinone oxidoreductase subunit N
LGVSFIYGFCGTLKLPQLAIFFDFDKILNLELRFLIGVLFVFLGILLKLGVVPFHFWIADVYQGSPLAVTFFFATVPKIVLIFLFLKVFNIFSIGFFYNLWNYNCII